LASLGGGGAAVTSFSEIGGTAMGAGVGTLIGGASSETPLGGEAGFRGGLDGRRPGRGRWDGRRGLRRSGARQARDEGDLENGLERQAGRHRTHAYSGVQAS
jgi:hypothetical protein